MARVTLDERERLVARPEWREPSKHQRWVQHLRMVQAMRVGQTRNHPGSRVGRSRRCPRLRRQDGVTILGLSGLPADGVRQIVDACLGGQEVPADLAEWIEARSDGNPFLVEELLAGLVATGTLRPGRRPLDDERATLTPSVPFDLETSIRQRLAPSTPRPGGCSAPPRCSAGASTGSCSPASPRSTGAPPSTRCGPRSTSSSSRWTADGFLFRHALTREAVLGELLPPERRDLASPRLAAIERANPGLPGAVCELAADLAEAAGDHGDGRRAARRERPAGPRRRRARQRRGDRRRAPAARRRRRAVALDADEVLVQILAAAGKPAAALAVGRPLVAQLPSPRPGAEAVDLLLVLARAALAAGDTDAAARRSSRRGAGRTSTSDARRSRRASRPSPPTSRSTRRRLDEAADAGASARSTRPPRPDQPAVECEALEVLGRVAELRRHPARRGRGSSGRPSSPPGTGWRAGTCGPAMSWRSSAWADGDTRAAARHARPAPRATGRWSPARDGPQPGRHRPRRLRPGRRASPRRAACVDASRRYGLATRAGRPPLAGRRARPRRRRRRPWRRPSPTRSPATPTTRGSSATCTAGCCATRAFVARRPRAAAGATSTR